MEGGKGRGREDELSLKFFLDGRKGELWLRPLKCQRDERAS